jgi:nucleoside-diphosphate-sugar epimerase
MRLLVTGGSGFVGSAVLERFSRSASCSAVAAVRESSSKLPPRAIPFSISGLTPEQDWRAGLEGTDAVVHLAARVHVMHDTASDPLAAFRHANVEGTLHLARQAAAAGVKRFVFVSSIKVNGEQTLPGAPFRPDDAPAPVDPYGVSKLEAEQGLRRLAIETGLEIVVIRPPLVYGPGVKANFLRMMTWLQRGYPLPLGSIHNRRSLVALENLVDLIETCVHHPAAAQQTFLVSDGEDVSTTALLQRVAAALGRPARLLPVPAGLLRAAAKALGKAEVAQRLCGSLQVDIAQTQARLGWQPVVTLDEALAGTARHFLKQAQ